MKIYKKKIQKKQTEGRVCVSHLLLWSVTGPISHVPYIVKQSAGDGRQGCETFTQ